MAERTVSVKLMANVTQYEAAMKSAASASGRFSAETQGSLNKLGGDMQRVGGTLSRAVTLPLIAAGVGAVKLGLDFETAFSRMVGLAGVAAGEIDGLKQAVLDLAGETGQAPVDLANALYEAASAGLDSAQAMQAVEVAAIGAAAGMGSAEDIVGLVASATASYGAANITASEAVDILTQTIREGRADPEELAGSLGRILPIAAQLGVTFSEVGGLVAYTTNAFGDTDRAITGVNDTLAKLSAPGALAKQVLLDMGTSVTELHAAIREDGLLGGLELLRDHGFAGNADAIRKLMPDMQGAATLTLLLNDNAGTLNDTLAATADSTGAAGEAFATAADTDMFKLKVAWAELQVALIEAGDIIIPIVTGIVTGVGDLAEAFTNLPGPVQAVVLGFLALLAAVGPLLSIGGRIVTNIGMISTGFEKLGISASTASVALGAVGIVLAGAAIIYGQYAGEKAEARARTDEFVSALKAEASGQRDATSAAIAAKLANNDVTEAITAAGLSVRDVARVIRGESVPAVEQFLEVQSRFGGDSRVMKARMDELGVTYTASVSQANLLARTIDELGTAHGEAVIFVTNQATAERELGVATDGATATSRAATLATDDQVAATEDLIPTTADATARTKELADAFDRKRDAAIEAMQAQQQLREEMQRAVSQTFDLERASLDLVSAVADLETQTFENNLVQMDGKKTAEEKAASSRDLRLAELDAADGALQAAGAFAESMGAAEGSAEKTILMRDYLIRLQDQIPGLRDEIQAYIDKLNAIPTTKTVTIRQQFTTSGQEVLRGAGPDLVGAEGMYLSGPTRLLAGEAGDEVLLPLTNPARMRELATDPRVFGRLMSALGGGGGGVMAPTGGGGGGSTVVMHNQIIVQTLRADLEAGRVIQQSLQEWERLGGTGWRQ